MKEVGTKFSSHISSGDMILNLGNNDCCGLKHAKPYSYQKEKRGAITRDSNLFHWRIWFFIRSKNVWLSQLQGRVGRHFASFKLLMELRHHPGKRGRKGRMTERPRERRTPETTISKWQSGSSCGDRTSASHLKNVALELLKITQHSSRYRGVLSLI